MHMPARAIMLSRLMGLFHDQRVIPAAEPGCSSSMSVASRDSPWRRRAQHSARANSLRLMRQETADLQQVQNPDVVTARSPYFPCDCDGDPSAIRRP
jgi:hypothetical protein